MKKLFIFFILFLIPLFLYAELNLSQIYFEKATKEYMEGKTDDAIKSLQKALKYKKNFGKARVLLGNLLVKKAGNYFENGEIEEAYKNIKKAKELIPNDSQINKMYSLIKPAYKKYKKQKKSKKGKTISSTVKIDNDQKEIMQFLLDNFNKQQEQFIKLIMQPQKAMENYLKESTKQQNKILDALTSQYSSHYKFMRDVILTLTAFILIILFTVYKVMNRFAKMRRDEILMQQDHMEKIISAMQTLPNKKTPQLEENSDVLLLESSVVEDDKKDLPESAPQDIRKMLKDPDPQKRAKGVVILEAEIVDKDPDASKKLLEPLLKDSDPKVKAHAARVYTKYDFKKGMEILQKMVKDDNRWVKIAALQVLQDIPSDKSASIFISMLDETDGRIVSIAAKGLKKFKENNFEGISEKVAKEIDKVLSFLIIK